MTDGEFSLHGRGVVVTGAGGHLGSAMTLALARAGALVVAMGRTESSLESLVVAADGLDGKIVISVGNVSHADDVADAIALPKAHGVALHGWVNNAYVDTPSFFGALDRNEVEQSIRSGLVNPMLITDQVASAMRTHGQGGSIVNIASMYGSVSPTPNVYADNPDFQAPPAYTAAKAGLIQFTRHAATYLSKDNIRVNALSPGAFPGADTQSETSFMNAIAARTPMNRIGRPSELGGSIVYLISDASSFMTGHNLVVDGGWTAW